MIYDLQKAGILKRISAFLFDFTLIIMLAMVCAFPMLSMLNYDPYIQELDNRFEEICESYGIPELEAEHNVTIKDYRVMIDDDKATIPQDVRDTFDECLTAYYADGERLRLLSILMSLSLIVVSFSTLIAFILLEFAVPLILKNGQTLGKKIFSIAVVRTDAVKVSPLVLFVRTILGKYTIGTMIPLSMILLLIFEFAFLFPAFMLLLILALQVTMFFTSKTRSVIHDLLSSTVVVDFNSQMIFDSVEAREEYVRRLQEEKDARADY